jgi:hypothetical protein
MLIVMLIEKKSTPTEFRIEKIQLYLNDPLELFEILEERRSYEFSATGFKALKDFVTDPLQVVYQADLQKNHVFSRLYKYITEVYKKFNVRNTMAT